MPMSYRILSAAERAGAHVLTTACPLCQFNLDWLQARLRQQYASYQPLPVMYFTQLMGLAFGLDTSGYGFELHYVDPRPVLARAGVLGEVKAP